VRSPSRPCFIPLIFNIAIPSGGTLLPYVGGRVVRPIAVGSECADVVGEPMFSVERWQPPHFLFSFLSKRWQAPLPWKSYMPPSRGADRGAPRTPVRYFGLWAGPVWRMCFSFFPSLFFFFFLFVSSLFTLVFFCSNMKIVQISILFKFEKKIRFRIFFKFENCSDFEFYLNL
jgi:hypothetical protein